MEQSPNTPEYQPDSTRLQPDTLQHKLDILTQAARDLDQENPAIRDFYAAIDQTRQNLDAGQIPQAALPPLVAYKEHHPNIYAAIERSFFNIEGGYTPLNQVLSYETTNENEVRIHIQPNYGINPKTFVSEVKAGLRELQGVLQQRPDIEMVRASSWLIFDKPNLISALGFTLDDGADTEASGRKVRHAHMSRKDFLNHSYK